METPRAFNLLLVFGIMILIFRLPAISNLKKVYEQPTHREVIVLRGRTTTAYCLTGIMADGKRVHAGAIACPRRIKLGANLRILGATYTCEDRLAPKFDDRFDIWFPNCRQAIIYGKQKRDIKIINPPPLNN
jgi:3D (Asp-Asp-Asp) domain-containing protein